MPRYTSGNSPDNGYAPMGKAMQPNNEPYEQKIAYARASLWAPFYAVGMVARIQGNVPTMLLEESLRKLQTLYPPLASRVRVEQDGSAWLTTKGVGECPLEVRSKTSGDDWVNLFLEQEKIPFAFERGPLTRFFLLRGDQSSDLIAIAPHVVCDGYSMTQVMGDAVALLNDPEREVTRPAFPPAVTWQNVTHSARDNLFLRVLVRVLNRVWPDGRVVTRQEGYEELHRSYWARQQNGLLAFELSPDETSALAARCRQRGVSVTGALVAAFLLAQADVLAIQPARYELTIAVSIRDRLVQLPDRAVGVYASSLDLALHPKLGNSFWKLAREGHARIHQGLGDRARILKPLVLNELDPLIADELIAGMSTNQWSGASRLLTRFVKIIRETRCMDVSNIGRIDLPEVGGPYRLETLLPFPPMVPGGRMALNVLTVNGQMNIILKFRQNEMDDATVTRIKDRALSYLSGAGE
ncbi:MAG TPA: hypothetical protein VFF78_07720 [Anaerolineaceae bacterium]|nr:hypothetical protein [Anaerolineaceae bacterium]